MAEKDKPQENSSNSERNDTQIDALLQEMIKKEASPSPPKNDKTPLDNLKNILSQADQVASPIKEGIAKQDTVVVSVGAKKNENTGAATPKALVSDKKSVSLPEAGPVEKLSELIKAYRASKR